MYYPNVIAYKGGKLIIPKTYYADSYQRDSTVMLKSATSNGNYTKIGHLLACSFWKLYE